MRKKYNQSEDGYALLLAIVLSAITLTVSAGMVNFTSFATKTHSVINDQNQNYYEVEQSLGKAVSWLQENSEKLLPAFTDSEFSKYFAVDDPFVGDNEASHFEVTTSVRGVGAGASKSILLSNDDNFGVPYFPVITDPSDSSTFDPVASFQAADLGEVNVRLILLWARESGEDYSPVFRVDAITDNNPDRGAHIYSYVYGKLGNSGAVLDAGFYSKNSINVKRPCYSKAFTYSSGSWSDGADKENCSIASDNNITISNTGAVNGDVYTLSATGVSDSDEAQVSGGVCEGAGCHAITMTSYSNWPTKVLNPLSICYGKNSATYDRINLSNAVLPPGCYRDVTIENSKKLILNTGGDYHFRSITFGNKSEIDITALGDSDDDDDGEIDSDKVVTLYTDQFNGSKFNGNNKLNANSAPHQLNLIYTGTSELKLNGIAEIRAFIVAPYATVNLLGNFKFYGGIKALTIAHNGNARLYYDENAGVVSAEPSDMNFSTSKISHRFR